MPHYEYIPKQNPNPEDVVNTLFGCQTYLKHCAGFCCRKGKYLTIKMIKNKKCLAKNCENFVKVNHPYWQHRENIKTIRRINKIQESIENETL